MGFDDSKGHTAALNLEDLEKGAAQDDLSNWKSRVPEKSAWASKDWDGNSSDWPEEFDGHGGSGHGTAILDLDELGLSGGNKKDDVVFDRPNSFQAKKVRGEVSSSRSSNNDWPEDFKSSDSDDFEGEGFSDGNFGDGSESTMALDIGNLDLDSRPSAGTQKDDDARYEDERTSKREKSKQDFDFNTYGSGDDVSSKAPAKPDTQDSTDLGPNERTMALDLNQIRGDIPSPPTPLPPSSPPEGNVAEIKTMAMDVESLRQGAGLVAQQEEKLTPNARTMALNIPSPSDLVSHQNNGNSTTIVDTSSLDDLKTEAESGGKLVVFYQGQLGPQVFKLRPGISAIGKDQGCDLVLQDQHVSAKHLRIKKRPDGHFELRKITGEVKVNGCVVQSCVLKNRDEVSVGTTTMRFVLGEPSPVDLAPPRQNPANQGGGQNALGLPTWMIVTLGLCILGCLFVALILILVLKFL